MSLSDRAAVLALRDRLASDGVELVEEWNEPGYVSVKCRDPDGYIVEAAWEPETVTTRAEVHVERRAVNPWTWQDQFGYVQANETSGVQRVLFCSGQTSVDADGQPMHEGDMGAQIGQALDNVEAVLREAGFELADVVRLNYYVTDVDAFTQAGEVYGAKLAEAGCRPASTLLGVARLAYPSLLVEIEATAVR